MAIFASSFVCHSQKMSFITLDIKFTTLPIQNADSTWSGQCVAWYGVVGCPYSKSAGGEWTGFVQYAVVSYTTKKTFDTNVIQQTALAAVDAYRKKNYPDIK